MGVDRYNSKPTKMMQIGNFKSGYNFLNKSRIRKSVDHPVKLKVLKALERNGSMTMGSIIQHIATSSSSGVKHVLELKRLGLLTKNTTSQHFELDSKKFSWTKNNLKELF